METWSYRFFIAAPAENIYAHLNEPKNYVGLSPLVTKVMDIHQRVNQDGLVVSTYTSIEQLHFLGRIPYDNIIHVTMTAVQPNRELTSDVRGILGVKVRFVTQLEPVEGGTWVEETITTHSPRLLASYIVNTAKEVQQQRAQILKKRMESAFRP